MFIPYYFFLTASLPYKNYNDHRCHYNCQNNNNYYNPWLGLRACTLCLVIGVILILIIILRYVRFCILTVRLTEYITNIKMREAARLLRETQKHITEITILVGYDNANYFSRIFKKQYGTSPSEYRRGSECY